MHLRDSELAPWLGVLMDFDLLPWRMQVCTISKFGVVLRILRPAVLHPQCNIARPRMVAVYAWLPRRLLRASAHVEKWLGHVASLWLD